MTTTRYVSLIFCFLLFGVLNANAFNDITVHPFINEAASQTSQSSLDGWLIDMGFPDGITEELRGESNTVKTIVEWIKLGGTDEDKGLRSLQHFHDPTKQWGDAGLWEESVGFMHSSLLWAQNDQDNHASWIAARTHLYQALITGVAQEREQEYVKAFVALGQVVHLVSDLAVPAHVRNDAHIVAGLFGKYLDLTHFEVWTSRNAAALSYDGTDARPPESIFSHAVGDQVSLISALWDSDRYDISVPNPAVTLEPIIGLAEYTNANFFSEDTAFSTKYPFPHNPDNDPSVERQTRDIDPFSDGNLVAREYWIKRDTTNNSEYRLSGVNYNTFWKENLYVDGFGDFDYFPPMDRDVFKDYANRLVPRAVGYSAALLDYFCKIGRLEISSPDQYIYAIIDGSEIEPTENTQYYTQYIRHLQAKVRNSTPYEEMLSGSLVAVAKYKKIIGYQPDLSSGSPTAEMREAEFSYSTSEPIEIASLSSTTAEEFSFDFTNSPIPAGITDLYLQVVFKGTLGDEINTAIAIGMKDLNEPQHITIWNDTDYFLLDGVPVTADDVRRDRPLVEELAYIDPYPFTDEIGFSQLYPDIDAPPIVRMQDLPPARYSRIILVTDASDSSYFLTDHVSAYWSPDEPGIDPPSFDVTWKYSLPTAVHQEDSDGVWHSSPVYRSRDVIQHQRIYLMNSYPYFVYINSLPAPPENELGPFSIIDLSN